MIPYLLTAFGGYLIGNSLSTKFANGGDIESDNANEIIKMLSSKGYQLSKPEWFYNGSGYGKDYQILGFEPVDAHTKYLGLPIKKSPYGFIVNENNKLRNFYYHTNEGFNTTKSFLEFLKNIPKNLEMDEFEFERKETEKEFANGGEIANNILSQLGGARRLNIMTGAYNFVDLGDGLSFKLKNPRANYVKIKLNSMDLYDIEVGRIRGTTYKVIDSANNMYFDQLIPYIEKATGMYLRFDKGGVVYKLGDMWSKDFDYTGMLETGLESDLNWGVEKLSKLFESFQDVNYHTIARPLWNAIENLKKGDTKLAQEKLDLFKDAIMEELSDDAAEVAIMANGGNLKNKYQIASDYWKQIEQSMTPKQKVLYKKAYKRLEDKFDQFNDREIAEYIQGSINEYYNDSFKLTNYEISGANWFKLGFKYIAHNDAIKEPEWWEDMANGGSVSEKYNVINDKGEYFSVSMQTGKPKWSDNVEFGYVYDKQGAEKIVEQLKNLGVSAKINLK
jgi:hypothetical protein